MSDPIDLAGRRVVVTGGAGFLGTPTVALLRARGAEVAVVRSAEHDLRDPGACRAALAGAELVIHLAARVGGIGFNRRNPGPLAADNLAMATNVFEACRAEGSGAWSPPARSAPIPSTPRSRFARTRSGTASRNRRTRPTGSRSEC